MRCRRKFVKSSSFTSSSSDFNTTKCLTEMDNRIVSCNEEYEYSSDEESEVEDEPFVLSSDSEDDAIRDIYGIPKDLNIVFVDIETAKKELNSKGFVLKHLEQDGEVERIVCTCDGAFQCLYHIKIEEPLNIKEEEPEIPKIEVETTSLNELKTKMKLKLKNEPEEKKIETIASTSRISSPKLNNSNIKDKDQKNPKLKRKQYKCKICDKILNLSGKYHHLRTHKKPFVCEFCGLRFSLKGSLKAHLLQHTGEKPHVCEFCGRSFSRKDYLTEHLHRHTGKKPIVCEHCGKSFRTKPVLKTHLLVHNIGYGCEFCSKVFRYEKSLNSHKQNIHSEEKPFVCTHCNQRYCTLLAFTNHLETHGIKRKIHESGPLLCQICDKEFLTKNRLKSHLLTHGDQKFSCSFCAKAFNTKARLMVHNRVHTGEKQNVCKSCGRTFNSVPGLQHHMYFHTGEKPYECKMCDKAYVLAENLKYHMMVHTGEKPYSCPHCDKKSRSKFDMECHIRIHTGEKPFKCDTCSKAFRNPRYLKSHKKKAH
ncbi:gastrula zinc finger protein XlCGF26.1 [Tribolium castaneum]|uniref:gastrula zinc finger protein XlCGF26.1 n=1 Tax=Tribolium castaneum TaxID=7070 RepID=UPI0030FEADB8